MKYAISDFNVSHKCCAIDFNIVSLHKGNG